ncbi:MAG: hypothetical protein N2V73_07305 [Candidatus Methanospirare jalkutatii]|nr:hypothetical protein [Candidatus Methanospirare jalkutatii]
MGIRGGIRERCGREESNNISIFTFMILLTFLLMFPTPSVCKLTPPPPPKVTEMTLSTINSPTVNSNNITVIATVKKWEGNLTRPEGFVIEFEIEEVKVKGEESGYYLTKSIAQTDANGKAYTNLILESVNETAPVEVVVKASWHKGHPGGVSVSKRVNVTSVGSSEREKVPVMSLWGIILLVVLLCLFAAYSIRKGKGMGRMM